MDPPPMPDREEANPLDNAHDAEPQTLRGVIYDGMEMQQHNDLRSSQCSRSSERSQSSGSSGSSKMSTYDLTQTEHVKVAVDDEPTLNLEKSTFYIGCTGISSTVEKTSRVKGLSESGESNTSSYGTCKAHSQDELDGVV